MEIGTKVERIASDYTGGRKGVVIEMDTEAKRARVHWTEERSGTKMNLRTWVKWAALLIIY